MRRMSMATRNELVEAIAAQYARSDRADMARILGECVAVTDFHRRHVMRLLRGGAPAGRSGLRLGRRVYEDAVREALLVIREASDRICGKGASRSWECRLQSALEAQAQLWSDVTLTAGTPNFSTLSSKAPNQRAILGWPHPSLQHQYLCPSKQPQT
jgi:hypothetical protein